MNVEEYMKLHGLTDADLDRIAEPYEKGTFELEPGEVHIGSHILEVLLQPAANPLGAGLNESCRV